MQTTIEIKTIKFLLHFAAKKKYTRYYLEGVHIEQGETGTFAVATNGHFMAVARIDTQAHAPASVIVKSDHLAAAIKGAKSAAMIDADGTKVTITLAGVHEVAAQAVDGRYPDWRRVIRAPQTGEQAYFNPDYLATVQKAARGYRGNKSPCHVAQNGNSVGHCAIDEDLQVFVMPAHQSGGSNPVAHWVATC